MTLRVGRIEGDDIMWHEERSNIEVEHNGVTYNVEYTRRMRAGDGDEGWDGDCEWDGPIVVTCTTVDMTGTVTSMSPLLARTIHNALRDDCKAVARELARG